LLGFPVFKEAG